MVKLCRICKTEQEHGSWTNRKTGKSFSNSKCRKCAANYSNKRTKDKRKDPVINAQLLKWGRDYFQSKKDGLHHVYILPIEHYAGVTDNPFFRGQDHRSKGKNTEGFRIIHSTKNRNEALELEALLHDLGYKGRNASYDS